MPETPVTENRDTSAREDDVGSYSGTVETKKYVLAVTKPELVQARAQHHLRLRIDMPIRLHRPADTLAGGPAHCIHDLC